MIIAEETTDEYCPNCGGKVDMPKLQEASYQPVGAAALIEDLITKLGKDVKLCRRGPNNWEIQEGSATIYLGYNTKSGFIVGDASICQLPKTKLEEIYEYLLRENYSLERLTFSVREQDIILSFITHHEDLKPDTGLEIFNNLFKKADYYDNILIEKYGALPKSKAE